MSQDLNLSMFRAYDIRTPAADLTPALAARLARAEARYFRETLNVPGIIVGHDARLSGPHYLAIAAEIYQRNGLDVVWLPGVTSTSHFYFTAMQYPECAGVLFGASHNPAGDTGRKIVGPLVRPIAEHIGPDGGLDRVKENYIKDAPERITRTAHIRAVNNLWAYVEYSMRLAGVHTASLRGVPLLHDYLFGAGGTEMITAFGHAGADLHPLHYAPDGKFPLGDPNPVKPEVIKEGLAALKGGGYLFGAFFDGDADRVDFYAGSGDYLSSSFVYAGILPYIRERFSSSDAGVFADLKSNPLAVIEMAKAGFNVQVIRNGHSQIKEAMLQDTSMIGTVEESAHFYEAFFLDGKGPYCSENTLYISLLAARAWQEHPERFAELLAIQATSSREREWGHHFPSDSKRTAALEAVQEHFEKEGASALTSTRSGLDLEATLMRRGLPFEIDRTTVLAPDWLQVCQRISQSENGLARWEVCAASPDIAAKAKADILKIVKAHGGGKTYQG